MPKYGIHHVVLQETIGRLISDSTSYGQEAGNEMATHKDIAMLGAIGPDLFFWAPD